MMWLISVEYKKYQGRGELSLNEVTLYLTIYDPLLEKRPNRWLLQNEIEARKVDAVIIPVGDQIFLI